MGGVETFIRFIKKKKHFFTLEKRNSFEKLSNLSLISNYDKNGFTWKIFI